MEEAAFRRPYDLSDEANSYGYGDFEPFNEPPPAASSSAPTAAAAAAARPRHTVRTGPPKRDLMAMTRVMHMTSTLQATQTAQEAEAAAQAKLEKERLRQERNAKWEAVKASMSARPTPLHTVRAYDSDWSDSDSDDDEAGGDVQSMRSVKSTRSTATTGRGGTALAALVPTLAEERAVRAGPLFAVESVSQRVCHFFYNWWMYFVYALSASMVPGSNSRKGADSNEYFNRKKYA